MASDESQDLMQAVRRSHCARDDREHECVGTVTITRDGYDLSCQLCGSDDVPVLPSHHLGVARARRIVERAGLRWESLSPETMKAVADEVLRDYCPFCGRAHFLHQSHARCGCGATYSDYSGWERARAAGGGS